MPTIKRSFDDGPLTEGELPVFVAWATTRCGFRPDETRDRIPELGGAYHYQRRPWRLAELVERWRSLGRPSIHRATTRPQYARAYRPRANGLGAARGAARSAARGGAGG